MGNYGKIKPADQILIQSLVCKQKESETPGEIQRKVLHRGTIGVKSQQEDRHQQGKGRQRTDLLLVLSRQLKKKSKPNKTRPKQMQSNLPFKRHSWCFAAQPYPMSTQMMICSLSAVSTFWATFQNHVCDWGGRA